MTNRYVYKDCQFFEVIIRDVPFVTADDGTDNDEPLSTQTLETMYQLVQHARMHDLSEVNYTALDLSAQDTASERRAVLNAFDKKAQEYKNYQATTRRLEEVREVLARTIDELEQSPSYMSIEQQAWEVISEIHHQDKAYWQDVKNHYLNSLKTKG